MPKHTSTDPKLETLRRSGTLHPRPEDVPMKELIVAVVEMKRRNRTWGCKRIAQQIALAFGVDIDKDVVRRILSIQKPNPKTRIKKAGTQETEAQELMSLNQLGAAPYPRLL